MSTLALQGGVPVRQRPFHSWPVWDQREENAILEVLRSGKWWRFSYGEGIELREPESGERSRVVQFQEAFARHHHAQFGLACANGTAAIEILLKALGIGPGDEVIVPAYTYVATASAVLQVNAIPVFVDIHPDTYNIDAAKVEAAINPRTRAIVAVHFAGQPADIDSLLHVTSKRGVLLIEDAAHAHGSEWKGRKVGSLADGGTFSFQASKNMTAGEGGLITTNDTTIATLCDSYLWAGREPGRPWYEHHRLGWNYRLTEFQAAILSQQLARLDEQNSLRIRNAERLSQRLAEIDGISPLSVDPRVSLHSYHIYLFRYSEAGFGGVRRSDFLKALQAEGIPCIGGYSHPLYRNPMFVTKNFYPRGCPLTCGHYDREVDFQAYAQLCPVAEQACLTDAVWLEHRLLLGNNQDIDDIADAIQKVRANADVLRRSSSA
jgi:dTDP-4-amino-4,6-dideoxygalactose transaminase